MLTPIPSVTFKMNHHFAIVLKMVNDVEAINNNASGNVR